MALLFSLLFILVTASEPSAPAEKPPSASPKSTTVAPLPAVKPPVTKPVPNAAAPVKPATSGASAKTAPVVAAKKPEHPPVVGSEPRGATSENQSVWEILKGKRYGIGLDVQFNYVPRAFLSLFMDASHTVASPAAALRLLMRTKHLDVIVKGAMWNVSPPDGVYLSKGYDWSTADYASFDSIHFYYMEVALLWKKLLAPSLYLTWGGGLGGGWITGKMHTTAAQGCRPGNYDNISTSHTWLGSDYCYRDNYREFWNTESFPAIMGMIEGTVGLRYDVTDHLTMKLETGLFLPGFIHFSFALEYIF
ncbi:hypothetical protein KKF84_12510 [Myxococcota bacterium]|nr:hypothetical protein [Myxococcota bacterium]MBU1536138.1 hypothetical protein [Myxococcota bacterium]